MGQYRVEGSSQSPSLGPPPPPRSSHPSFPQNHPPVRRNPVDPRIHNRLTRAIPIGNQTNNNNNSNSSSIGNNNNTIINNRERYKQRGYPSTYKSQHQPLKYALPTSNQPSTHPRQTTAYQHLNQPGLKSVHTLNKHQPAATSQIYKTTHKPTYHKITSTNHPPTGQPQTAQQPGHVQQPGHGPNQQPGHGSNQQSAVPSHGPNPQAAVTSNQPSHQPEQAPQPQLRKQLSAKELTGAPLISLVSRTKRNKKKNSDPSLRLRHCSQPNYFLGQNLYRNLYIQDFYHNPVYAMQSNPVFPTHQHAYLRREGTLATPRDTLSDSYSVSSDDLDNFVPRIIKPRRRRKKERRRREGEGGEEDEEEGEGGAETCLGAEKQWLPQGLLSAESSADSRSDSGSSEEAGSPRVSRPHRKLRPTHSVPAYSSYPLNHLPIIIPPPLPVHLGTAGTSDYSSLNSNSSDTPPSSSTDHLCDSDSSRYESGSGSSERSVSDEEKGRADEYNERPALRGTKSTSSSFFRSPMLAPRWTDTKEERAKKLLRKTNSWHHSSFQEDSRASFSLFSPAGSIDLLSGIRKNLSKLDLNSEEE